jgi:hypothetical protein
MSARNRPSRRPKGQPRRAKSPLRRKLEGILALSLAAPVATAVACGTSGAARPACDDSSDCKASADASVPPFDAASADAGSHDDANACASISVAPDLFGEDGSCGRFVYLPCGVPPDLRGVGCNPSADLCAAACPQSAFFICDFPAPTCSDGGLLPDAAVYLDCTTCLGNVGRRPAGLRAPGRSDLSRRDWSPSHRSALADFFVRTAYLEAASVAAFHQLHTQLATLNAPPQLRRAALRAAADEARHAHATTLLARAFGGSVEQPRTARAPEVTLEELALENAVEGCVRETFGALVALHQAAKAAAPRVARVMRRIADDEVRHAELALAIHRWAVPRIDEAARRRIRLAQERALRELLAAAGAFDASVVREAGVPAPNAERGLIRELGRAILGVGASGASPCTGASRQRCAAA